MFERFVLAAAVADLDEAPRTTEFADAIEFRMDLADEPDASLEAYDGPLPLIVTNRAPWDGGEASADEFTRTQALLDACEREPVAALDLELGAADTEPGTRVLERAAQTDTAVIISTHDFEATPPKSVMADRLVEASQYGDVAKLAVTAHSHSDALALLSVTQDCVDSGLTIATMAMGEAGRHTRALAPVYGSTIGYAPPTTEKATAPGQFDLETLRGLISALE